MVSTIVNLTWSGAVLIAFLCGILISFLWVRRKYQKLWLGKKRKSRYIATFADDIWSTIIDACVHDFRVQSIAGGDPDLFELLLNPVHMDTKYLEESPLLPGEVALILCQVNEDFIESWRLKQQLINKEVDKFKFQKKILYLHLYDDFIESLDALEESKNVYFIYLKTPGHLHMIVIKKDFTEVVAVAPGIESLHKGFPLFADLSTECL